MAKETLNTLKKAGAIASTPPTIVTPKSTPTPISTAATSSVGPITTNKVTAVNASGALGDHMSMATKGRDSQVCSVLMLNFCVYQFLVCCFFLCSDYCQLGDQCHSNIFFNRLILTSMSMLYV